jgi:hypothetical protein
MISAIKLFFWTASLHTAAAQAPGNESRMVHVDSPKPVQDDSTTYYHAIAFGEYAGCQQIPEILLTNSVYCHGPFPVPDWNIPPPFSCVEPLCDTKWKAGSCSDNGFGKQNGQSINATDQTDMYTCEFVAWDYDNYLPPDLSETHWEKR